MEISLSRFSKITGCSQACLQSFIQIGEIKITDEGNVNLLDSSNADFLNYMERVAMKRALLQTIETTKI